MSRRQLTRKQHDFLKFLREHVEEREVWPTYREVVEHFGYRSPNSVTQNLHALHKKGYLDRDHEGYHLSDRKLRSQGQGDVPVIGVLSRGKVRPPGVHATPGLTLTALFPTLQGARAYAVEDQDVGSAALQNLRYVLVHEVELRPGDRAILIDHGGHLRRASVAQDGEQLVFEAEAGRARITDPIAVLGRYAGHVGQEGLQVLPYEAPAAAQRAA